MSADRAGRYRKLQVRIWRHQGFAGLRESAQRLALYLLTGPQTNRIGLFHFSVATASEDLNVSVETLRKGLTDVSVTFGWHFDADARVFYIPSWWRWKAVRPVVTFAFVTGWRIQSEVLPLEWRNVDRQAQEVRLDPGTTKNKAGRVFPFTDELTRLFDALWAEHEALKKRDVVCPYVFQRHGKRIASFRGAWEKACEAAGCPGRIPHDLRRSAVRNMERSGLSRSVAMQLTGHKTESVYRRYAITSEADLREGVARLNAPPLAATGTTGTIQGQSKRSGTVSRFKKSRK